MHSNNLFGKSFIVDNFFGSDGGVDFVVVAIAIAWGRRAGAGGSRVSTDRLHVNAERVVIAMIVGVGRGGAATLASDAQRDDDQRN